LQREEDLLLDDIFAEVGFGVEVHVELVQVREEVAHFDESVLDEAEALVEVLADFVNPL